MIFIAYMIIFSDIAVSSAVKGLNLWLHIVFPSLLPFFICTEILNRTGFSRLMGIVFEPIMRPIFNVPGCGSFAVILGLLSGFPIGAKITSDLRKNNEISKIEAERLIAYTNNSGMFFIAGSVCAGMLKMPELGIFMLLANIMASLTVGIIFGFYKKNAPKAGTKKISYNSSTNNMNFSQILIESIKSSTLNLLFIGGFIILFSVIINILIIDNKFIDCIISGFIEITTGVDMISKITNISLLQKIMAISAIIGWSGFSVHFQVIGIISYTDISIKPYFIGKALQSAFCVIYIIIFWTLF